MSRNKYGHARDRHGSQRSVQSMKDRARSRNKPQGHFSDNRLIEEAFEKAPSTPGVHDVTVSRPSRVHYPDGTDKSTDVVRVVIGADGEPTTAFPYILGDQP